MLDPEDRVIFGCRTCRDAGRVYIGPREGPCPECSSWPPEKREDMIRAATRAKAEKPSITTADLTDDERELLKEWTLCNPHTSQLTFLTWIEGRRYDPSKDEEFLKEARKKFKKWEFLRFSSTEGPLPARIRHALETGETKHLTSAEKECYLAQKGSER